LKWVDIKARTQEGYKHFARISRSEAEFPEYVI
jgi:hypothetical protein